MKGLTGERSKQKSEGKGIDETERSAPTTSTTRSSKTVSPAQSAIDTIERALGIDNLYDAHNMQFVNHLSTASTGGRFSSATSITSSRKARSR